MRQGNNVKCYLMKQKYEPQFAKMVRMSFIPAVIPMQTKRTQGNSEIASDIYHIYELLLLLLLLLLLMNLIIATG